MSRGYTVADRLLDLWQRFKVRFELDNLGNLRIRQTTNIDTEFCLTEFGLQEHLEDIRAFLMEESAP